MCTDFRKPGSKDEYYDIDFWVNQKTGPGAGGWRLDASPRYTFEGLDFDETN